MRELIDCSQLGTNQVSIAASAPAAASENVNQSTNDSSAPINTPTVQTTKARKSRAKVSMTNKYLIGQKDLFVDPKYASRYEGPEGLEIEGKIVKCPNEKTNGSCFKVDWLVNLPATVDAGCLRTWYHKDTMTKPLREAIRSYEAVHGGQPNKQKRKRTPGTVSTGNSQVSGTPPDQVRWRSRTALGPPHLLVGLRPKVPQLVPSVTVTVTIVTTLAIVQLALPLERVQRLM